MLLGNYGHSNNRNNGDNGSVVKTIPVTYAGGVRSIEDMELVKRLGKDKVLYTLHFTILTVLSIFMNSLKVTLLFLASTG